MKKNPSLIGLLIIFGVIAFILVLYNFILNKKDGYVIDNPSNKILNIKINHKNYTIAPQQNIRINLPKGSTNISYTIDSQIIDTTVNIIRPNGLINPTFQEYYTFTRPYGIRKNKDSIFLSKRIIIDNELFYGSIQKSSNIYIENFYYNLDQNYPKFFIKSAATEKNTDLSKIFRKEDFKQFYFENYQ